jgi:hypothetical protein
MTGTVQGQDAMLLLDRNGQVVASAVAPGASIEPVPFPGTAVARLSTGPSGIGGVCCGVSLPEVSTTRDGVYFLSGENDLRYLGIDGSTGHAAQLPNVRGRSQAVFAVSPDDQRIAIAVFDWSPPPLKVTTYVEDVGGGNRVVIFSSTSAYEWPVGWHAGSLIVGTCCILGGAPNPYAAVEYHVADPSTGSRLARLGSAACPVIGPLVQAGTLCNAICTGGDVHNVPTGATVCLDVVDWAGKVRVLYRYLSSNNIGTWAALAPAGDRALVYEGPGATGRSVVRADGPPVDLPLTSTPVAWWLDSDTLWLAGIQGYTTSLYRISTGTLIPLADTAGFAQGVVPSLS